MLSARQPMHEEGADGEDDVADLIGRIHGAPLQPDRWPQVLARIGNALGGASVLLEMGYRRPCGVFVATASFAHPDCFLRDYLSRPDAQALYRDLWARPVGVPLLREPVPDDVPRAQGMTAHGTREVIRYLVAACLLRDEGFAAVIYLARRAEAFDRHALDLLHRLVPHLRQALQVQRRLSCLEAERNAAVETLDRLQLGVIVVDAAGRVLSLNRRAAEIIAAHDGLTVSGGRLEAATPTATAALIGLIDRAAHTGAGHGLFADSASVLPRPSARQPLAALVAPLRSVVAAFGSRCPAAAVFVTDPECEDETPGRVLRAVYGLTRTEAALIIALSEGRGLAQAAARLGVGLNTAKTHLRHVFEKMGVRNRTELIRLILKGPARLRFDPPAPKRRPASDGAVRDKDAAGLSREGRPA